MSQSLPAPGGRRGRRLLVAGVAVILAAAGAGAYAYATRRSPDATPRAAALPTKPVTRGDLVSTVQVPGQLGYAGSYALVGNRAGTVTAVPRSGEVIDRGRQAYAVDLRPIPLLFGTVPFYRRLSAGVTGSDVRQLEQNLVALGYASSANLTVDSSFTSATADAVKRWQHELGVDETGTVAPGDAVVAPAAVRVTSVDPLIGQSAQPGQPVLSGTGTAHNAHVNLQLSYRSLVSVNQAVRVLLPNGHPVDGKVSTIGTAAAQAPSQSQNGTAAQAGGQTGNCQGDNCPQAVPVDIRITSPDAALGGVFEGPVSITFPAETRRNVLSVPVEALIAGTEGQYAVVAVDRAGRRSVPVHTGMFTSGRVEISGDGITDGIQVEVPSL